MYRRWAYLTCINDVISLKSQNLIIFEEITSARPTIYSHQIYVKTNNSSDIYKGSVIHVQKCSFLWVTFSHWINKILFLWWGQSLHTEVATQRVNQNSYSCRVTKQFTSCWLLLTMKLKIVPKDIFKLNSCQRWIKVAPL